MRGRRTIAIVVAAVAVLSSPPLWGWSGASGFHSVIALFESHVHPDLPFDQFAAGRLGIIQPTWQRRYLYAAYRYLAGPGFDASEQKALVSLWNERLGLVPMPAKSSDWLQEHPDVGPGTVIKVGEASAAWLEARSKVPGVGVIDGISKYRSAPIEDGQFSFANCNDSSFITAQRTLDTMIGKFGLTSAQVKLWVAAQDQVFDNCSDDANGLDFSTDAWFKLTDEWEQARSKVPGIPPSSGYTNGCKALRFRVAAVALEDKIRDLGASNPQVKQWVEAQDKVFDACMHPAPVPFGSPAPRLAPDIPEPIKSGTPFENAQRAYQIASANFYAGNYDAAAKMFEAIAADSSSPWRQLAPYLVARATIRKATLSGEKNDATMLAQAEAQLNKIIATSGDDGVKRAARGLLGFVEARLHPERRQEELARAVMQSTSGDVLRQDVSDYIWMLGHTKSDKPPSDDLTDWLATFYSDTPAYANPATLYSNTDAIGHSIEKWKKTSSLPWLVAAISEIPATDPNAPALIESADKVAPASPAFATVTYHTARLLIGQGKAGDARAKLDAILARRDELPVSTVNELMALRMTTARDLNELLVDAPRTPLGITDDGDYEELPSKLDDQKLKDLAAGPLFDFDGAGVLTRWVPLSVQIKAAHSEKLPSSLRARVALAAFVRAILLGDESAARELAPAVIESFPKLKPAIDAWLEAKGADAQRFAGVYVMLQNPGMRFYVDPGPGRMKSLDEIDDLRDNWWPSRVGQNLQNQTYPGFLSAAEKKSADDEWQKLSAINAPNFLCTGAIAQARQHPNDHRAPEALYRCLRAVHLGCSNGEGTKLAKSAFGLLHRRYPDSEWAAKGKVWYSGDDCTNP